MGHGRILSVLLIFWAHSALADQDLPYYVQNGRGTYDVYVGHKRIVARCAIPPELCASKGLVVYADKRGEDTDIFLFDPRDGFERRITKNPSVQKSPWISGSRIVYADNRNRNWDIYLFDIETGQETRITKDASDQYKPSICGNLIVWQDVRHGSYDIYMYDIEKGAEIPVAVSPGLKLDPTVSHRIIAWRELRAGLNEIVVFAVGGAQTRIASSRCNMVRPVICSGAVSWLAYDGGHMKPHRVDLATMKRVLLPQPESNVYLASKGEQSVNASRDQYGAVRLYAFP